MSGRAAKDVAVAVTVEIARRSNSSTEPMMDGFAFKSKQAALSGGAGTDHERGTCQDQEGVHARAWGAMSNFTN
jgi:hypothetical protein